MPPLLKSKTRFSLKPYDRELIAASFDDISLWYQGYFDRTLFPWQRYFLEYPAKDRMAIAGIRSGKSYVAAVLLLHFAQVRPWSMLLNTCFTVEQAKIVYRTICELCELPRFRHWVANIERSPYPAVHLVNGSEIWFRSVGYEAESLRGYEFDAINADECSYIRSRQTIATLQGRLLGKNQRTGETRYGLFSQISSPDGKGTWVYDRWKLGDPAYPGADPTKYLSLRIRTFDNPLLDREALAHVMAGYTEAQRRQELEGEFLDKEGAVFRMDDITDACSDLHKPVRDLTAQIRQWQERGRPKRKAVEDDVLARAAELAQYADLLHFELDPAPGRRYLQSWDLGKKATEKGRNAAVGMIFDITDVPWLMVGFKYCPNQPYLRTIEDITRLHEKYNGDSYDCHTVIDATGAGGDVINEILTEEKHLKIDALTITGTNKPDIINAGVLALERTRVHFPFIKRFVDQLSWYVRDDKEIAQDCVIAYCMAMYRAHELVGLRVNRIHDPARTTPGGSQLLTPAPRVNYRRNVKIWTPTYNRYAAARRRSRA